MCPSKDLPLKKVTIQNNNINNNRNLHLDVGWHTVPESCRPGKGQKGQNIGEKLVPQKKHKIQNAYF